MNKQERINNRKNKIGSRLDRKLNTFSNKFNEIFEFYLNISRKGICSFSGSIIEVKFDINAHSSKFAFREYDNGKFINNIPNTKHPHTLKHVINGKKAWGLWVNEWSKGIAYCDFTLEEILKSFSGKNINIPSSLMIEFKNCIDRYKQKKYLEYYNELSCLDKKN